MNWIARIGIGLLTLSIYFDIGYFIYEVIQLFERIEISEYLDEDGFTDEFFYLFLTLNSVWLGILILLSLHGTYHWNVYKNKALKDPVFWQLILLCFSFWAMPIYWYKYILHTVEVVEEEEGEEEFDYI